MGYNRDVIHRHTLRLPDFDYSQPGAYFVTIIAWERACLFGEIINGECRLNLAGQCAHAVWGGLAIHFEVILDEFVVMPNHLHGILFLNQDKRTENQSSNTELTILAGQGRGEASGGQGNLTGLTKLPDASPLPPKGTQTGTLGAIIQNFKSVSTRRLHALPNLIGLPIWQRNYYERIICSEDELKRFREYIINNPYRWAEDDANPSLKSNRSAKP